MKKRSEAICDLLMGAAYADNSLHKNEKSAIEEYLANLMPDGTLPEDLQTRIDSFAKDKFDLIAVAKTFAGDSKKDRLKLLDVVAAVHAADGEFDFDEDDYLKSVAKALSLSSADTKEHALVYEVKTLQDYLAELRPSPPPPPAKQ